MPVRTAWLGLLAALAVIAAFPPSSQAAGEGTEDVLLVGNNWDGTADVVDPVRFKRLTRINIVPDLTARRNAIFANPVRLSLFLGVRALIGEGHDQLVDDMFTSPDGRFLYVSRPSLADVVAFDLRTRRIVWRTAVDGYRADHMAISPDGRRLLVSASTERKVHAIDTAAGRIVGEFESGDQPHENNYSHDGRLIYHASIGSVYTPLDDPALDATKGDRYFQVVDARTLRVLKRIDVGAALAAAGFPKMSSAVRPMALSPDERYVYMQLSFLHGFVEFDLLRNRPTRIARLPLSDSSRGLRRDQYVLDSAHHGLAMNSAGTKLCAAGTMSNYAAIVARDNFAHRTIHVGDKPYWTTNNADGSLCFVSVSGEDRVAVISYETAKQVTSIRVGDHPQRMRMGPYLSELLPGDRVPPRLSRLRVVRRKRVPGRALRLRTSERTRLVIDVRKARSGSRRYTRIRVVRRRIRAGTRRVALGRLGGAGRYRLIVGARDAAGNEAAKKRVDFRVRRGAGTIR
jgi:DNA-binding beta-propeller fold protein YncE